MDRPAALPLFLPPRAPACPADRCRFVVALWSLHGRVASDFSLFCVDKARRHCELRRKNFAAPFRPTLPATRPRARFGVTGPVLFAKGAPAGRGRDALGLPSETVGEGNMPFLMPGLDGEKLFTGRALARFGSACSFWGSRPVDLSPSDFVPRAPTRRAGFEPSWRGPSPALRGT